MMATQYIEATQSFETTEVGAVTSSVITHERTAKAFDIAKALITARAETGRRYRNLMRDIFRTSFGTGKLTAKEFFFFRLYEGAYSREDLTAFIGRHMEARTNFICNYDRSWFGVAEDKLLYQSVLGGMGLPVPELVGLYHHSRGYMGIPVVRTTEALAALLRRAELYPLFGKPNRTRWSVGASSIAGFDPQRDELIMLFGERVDVVSFTTELERYGKAGYLFQRRLDPHRELVDLAGPALPTVRVMCIQDERGPRILRAHLKLPGNKNIADNAWRSGNMIVHIDPATGVLQRALLGTGIEAHEITDHPHTHKRITNTQLPHWQQLREVVCEAMSCLPGLRLTGWDVALCERGPVLVEVNLDPDWALSQLVSGQGMWTGEFAAFVTSCRMTARQFHAQIRKTGA